MLVAGLASSLTTCLTCVHCTPHTNPLGTSKQPLTSVIMFTFSSWGFIGLWWLLPARQSTHKNVRTFEVSEISFLLLINISRPPWLGKCLSWVDVPSIGIHSDKPRTGGNEPCGNKEDDRPLCPHDPANEPGFTVQQVGAREEFCLWSQMALVSLALGGLLSSFSSSFKPPSSLPSSAPLTWGLISLSKERRPERVPTALPSPLSHVTSCASTCCCELSMLPPGPGLCLALGSVPSVLQELCQDCVPFSSG